MPETLTTIAIRRANQRYFEQTSSRETIPHGYAYYVPEHPRLAAFNFLGEATLDSAAALCAARDFFDRRGAVFAACVPAADHPTEPTAVLLEALGFQRREWLCLGRPPSAPLPEPATLDARILPARAMRRAYTAVVAARSNAIDPHVADALTALQLQRLDDAAYDAFIAFLDDLPAGIASLLQVGQIGRICDVFVLPSVRRRGVARLLVRHALLAARRWALHPVCASVRADDAPARALLEQAGFIPDGTIRWFALPGVELAGA